MFQCRSHSSLAVIVEIRRGGSFTLKTIRMRMARLLSTIGISCEGFFTRRTRMYGQDEFDISEFKKSYGLNYIFNQEDVEEIKKRL